jgi:ACS family glucarate transporter-like MFS transporter
MMVGSALAAAVTAPIVSWLTLRVGWRAAFYASSLLAFGIAIIWYVIVPHTPDASEGVNCSGDQGTDKASGPAGALVPLRRLLGDRNILMLSMSYTCEGYILFIFVFWLYIYLIEVRGFSILSGGFAASLPWMTALVFTLLGGWICDRITAKKGQLAGARTVIMAGYSLSGVLLFGAAKFDNRSACLAALCLSVGFLYFAESGALFPLL